MDIQFTEQLNGGDMTLLKSDVAVVYGVENMPYLSMFAGDFWGNYLMSAENFQVFDAETEAALNDNPLNSSGRINIENAMIADLAFIPDVASGTTISVQTAITNDDRLEAKITMNGEQINYLWNPQDNSLTND